MGEVIRFETHKDPFEQSWGEMFKKRINAG
ncbi:MAG: hypothetical protein PWP22_837 [Thermoanaerobacter sp.]|jgi:hypothetical protein|nr:hypothetical protein [Thermoanaerobacter sp.]